MWSAVTVRERSSRNALFLKQVLCASAFTSQGWAAGLRPHRLQRLRRERLAGLLGVLAPAALFGISGDRWLWGTLRSTIDRETVDDNPVMLCDNAPMATVRTFNTEGPVEAADHYCIPPLERIDLDAVLGLIRDKKYFVLHAPRQTGKTSALLALRDLLNGGGQGDFRCVYANVEGGQAMRENVAEGMRTVLGELALQANVTLGDETLDDLWPAILERVGPGMALRQALLRWSMADRRPLVLLIDEIDALVGDTLLAVLRQLRTGYVDRPARFPHSIILCGVRGRARLPHPLDRRKPHGARWQRIQHQGPGRCGWATSRSGRCARCWRSTRLQPDRRLRSRRCG